MTEEKELSGAHQALQCYEKYKSGVANIHQTQYLEQTVLLLAALPKTRNWIASLKKDTEYDPKREASIHEAMEYLEEYAVCKNPPDGSKKTGWWSSAAKLIERIEHISSQSSPHNKQDFEVFKHAMKHVNDNFLGDIKVVSFMNLHQLIQECEDTPTLFYLMTGQEATVPWHKHKKELIELNQSRAGTWGYGKFSSLGEITSIFTKLKAPDELLTPTRKLIERIENGQHIRFRGEDLTRYLKANKEEQEFIRAVMINDNMWGKLDSTIMPRDTQLQEPLFYSFLTKKIKEGMNRRQVQKLIDCFHDLEIYPMAMKNLPLALEGRRANIKGLLDILDEKDNSFLGAENRIGSSRDARYFSSTPLAGLSSFIDIAKKDPPKSTLIYASKALKEGCLIDDIDCIFSTLYDYYWRKKNPGFRAYFSSCATGKKYQANKEKHKKTIPNSESKDLTERSLAALKQIYDEISGLQHKVLRSRYLDDDHGNECETAVFIDDASNVTHFVIPHSMMFDRELAARPETCQKCNDYDLCSSTHEYISLVLFNPEKYSEEFLRELESTIPGIYELHSHNNDITRYSHFAFFPERLAFFYYNPILNKRVTPIEISQSNANMIVFPHNIAGSSYLTKSLRENKISLPPNNTTNEKIEINIADIKNPEKEEQIRNKLSQFTNRHIQSELGHRTIIYSPDLDISILRNLGEIYSHKMSEQSSFKVMPAYPRLLYSRE